MTFRNVTSGASTNAAAQLARQNNQVEAESAKKAKKAKAKDEVDEAEETEELSEGAATSAEPKLDRFEQRGTAPAQLIGGPLAGLGALREKLGGTFDPNMVGSGGAVVRAGALQQGGQGGFLGNLVIDKARGRAQQALFGAPAVPKDHPYAKYIDGMRSDLASRGLPTSAEGVGITVASETQGMSRISQHGTAIVRAIAGEVGTAPGAEVRVTRDGDTNYNLEGMDPARSARLGELGAKGNNRSFSELVEAQTIKTEFDGVHKVRRHVQAETEKAKAEGKPRVLSMSFSWNTVKGAQEAYLDVKNSPQGSALRQSAEERIGRPLTKPYEVKAGDTLSSIARDRLGDASRWPEIASDAGLSAETAKDLKAGSTLHLRDPEASKALMHALAEDIQQSVTTGEGKANLDAARAHLEHDVAEARKAGVTPFVTSGNQNAFAESIGNPEYGRNPVSGTPGLLVVGMSAINGTVGRGDDTVDRESSVGADIVGPGSSVPFANQDARAAGVKVDVDPEAPNGMRASYCIQNKDTLSGIEAKLAKFGVSREALRAANPGLDDSTPLFAGERLNLPTDLQARAGTAGDIGGSSFAMPSHAAGVTALMLKANPKLTPDQIEDILTDPHNLQDIENDSRDGFGVIDPVKMVQAAADLALD